MTVKIIKVYGERNSGTNYITQLLLNNLVGIEIPPSLINRGTGWKHGEPQPKLFNKKNTLFVCVVRDIEGWLNAMYHRPYHLNKVKGFNNFICDRNINKDCRLDDDPFEVNKNLFELRYSKWNSYVMLGKNGYKTVLVNLSFAQKNHGRPLVKIISRRFKIRRKKTFIPVKHHTKTGKDRQNEVYKVYAIFPKIHKRFVNKKVEKQINNLTFRVNLN